MVILEVFYSWSVWQKNWLIKLDKVTKLENFVLFGQRVWMCIVFGPCKDTKSFFNRRQISRIYLLKNQIHKNRDRKYNNTGPILVKITYFAPLYLHTLTNNAVHCNSCGRGMCEILVLRNMKWLRKKSEIAKFRSFAQIARWPSEKWLLPPS